MNKKDVLSKFKIKINPIKVNDDTFYYKSLKESDFLEIISVTPLQNIPAEVMVYFKKLIYLMLTDKEGKKIFETEDELNELDIEMIRLVGTALNNKIGESKEQEKKD